MISIHPCNEYAWGEWHTLIIKRTLPPTVRKMGIGVSRLTVVVWGIAKRSLDHVDLHVLRLQPTSSTRLTAEKHPSHTYPFMISTHPCNEHACMG